MSLALGIADNSPPSSDQESWDEGNRLPDLSYYSPFSSSELVLHAKTDLGDKTRRELRSQSSRLNLQPPRLSHLAGNLVNRDVYFREQQDIEHARIQGLEIQNRPSELPHIPESGHQLVEPKITPETNIHLSQGENPVSTSNHGQLGNSINSPVSQEQELEEIQSDGLYLNLSGNPSLAWDHLTALTALTNQQHRKTFPAMA